MLLAAAYLLLHQAPDPASIHVTYKTVAVPVSKAVAGIAKQTKTDLAVTGIIANEPIIVRLNNATLKDAMDQIASVTTAVWQRQGNAFTLQRTDEMQQQLEDKATQEKVDKYGVMLKKIIGRQKTKPLDQATAQDLVKRMSVSYTPDGTPQTGDTIQKQVENSEKLGKLDGDHRLIDEIVQCLDPQLLATDPYPDHIVLSNDPRPLQRKLNISNDDFLQMIQEQNNWTAAVNANQKGAVNYMFMGGGGDRRVINPNDARLVVTLSADTDSGLQITAYIVNSKEEEYMMANDYISPDFSFEEGDTPPITPPEEKPKPNTYLKLGLTPVKLSPEAQEMRELVAPLETEHAVQTRAASKGLQQLLLDPTNHDPLSWAPSEVLIGIAEQKDWNMVARLPDNDLISAGTESLDKSDPANFLYQRDDDCNVKIDGSWLTVKPKDTLDTEKVRVNRAALATYEQTILQSGYSSVEAEADFLAANQPGVDYSLASNYASMISPGSNSFDTSSYGSNDVDAMRFYGMLGPDLREQLQQGNGIQTSELNDEQQAALAHLVMQPPDPDVVAMMGDQQKEAQNMAIVQDIEDGKPQPMQKLDDEDTEFLTTATPPALITARFVQGHGLKVKYDESYPDMQNGQQAMHSYTVEQWADPEIGDYTIRRHGKDTSTSYAWADKRDIHLAIKLSDSYSISTAFTEHRNNLSVWGPVAQLPADLQKQVTEIMNQKNGMMGDYDVSSFIPDGSGGATIVTSGEKGDNNNGGGGGTPPPA